MASLSSRSWPSAAERKRERDRKRREREANQKARAANRQRRKETRDRWKKKAGDAKAWVGDDYLCRDCDLMVRVRDRKAHEKWHKDQDMLANAGKVDKKTAAAREKNAQRRQSAAVAAEMHKRKQASGDNTPVQPRESAENTARRSWGNQINDRRNVVAGEKAPSNGAQSKAASGPAGHIYAAARALADFEPANHAEMKELALTMNAAMGEFSKGVEEFQDRRVQQRFHPNTIRPIDAVAHAVQECRSGWTQMILAIERHYAAHFEAARQGGPVPGEDKGPNYFSEAAS